MSSSRTGWPWAQELVEGGVHVAGVPQHDAVEDEAERAELVFHALVVALLQLALRAVKDGCGEESGGLPGGFARP
jgi:hypothetical protein